MDVPCGVRPSIVLLSIAGTLEAPGVSCRRAAVLAEKPGKWQLPLCSLLFLRARVNHWHPDGVVKLSDRESACRVLAGLMIPAVSIASPRKCECAAGSWSLPLDACRRQLVVRSRLDKHHRHSYSR